MEELANRIKGRIRAEGPIPFASFMEMALYSPGLGYYASGRRRTGAAGDYYTSPQVHPVFGALLALLLQRMWQLMDRPSRFQVVEAGAGDWRLARDILDYSRHLEKDFFQALFYVAADIQISAGEHDTASLEVRYQHTNPRPRAVAARGLPFRGLRGCILSNELLDAFPVHRLVVQGGVLKEVYVTLDNEAFVEVLGELSPPVRDLLEVTSNLPPEGSHLEICPSAWEWMGEAARALDSGFVLTIDYGYGEATGEDTLASYRRHAAVNPYEMVGQQDLTAHVDFGAAMEAGRRVGLRPVGLVSQRRFLLDLGLEDFREAASRLRLPQQQHEANQMAMLDLIRSQGLGGFGVMVQCKKTRGIRMEDLVSETQAREGLAAGDLPVPLLSKEHMPLLEG
ncbi:MAG: SAM-dependent methyltransferase, partial [Dehalococcoidia bacterium]|nr:SAM-dependent methyltransferase [Dehalococcoidia bacterium]